MITLRRAKDRHCKRSSKHETWHTFQPRDGLGPVADSFGTLELLDEIRLSPGANAGRSTDRDAEVVTYVREGSLAYQNSLGRSGVIQAGEFQRRTPGPGIRHSEMNASRTDGVHFFQIWLRPSAPGFDPGKEQKRFSLAQRRHVLCVVASPDERRGSLLIHQNALICSAVLDPGQHLVHELSPRRNAWLHLVQGEIALGDAVLTTGDGVGISEERAISLTAREASEILLIDLDKLGATTSVGQG